MRCSGRCSPASACTRYYKFVRYEDAPPEPTNHDAVTEIPSGLLPERPKAATRSDDDPALREYNAYLADLAQKDKEHDRHHDRSPTTPVESIRKALIGYRVMAWTTGIWLIALCYEMVVQYVYKVEDPPTGSASCTAGSTSSICCSPPTSR